MQGLHGNYGYTVLQNRTAGFWGRAARWWAVVVLTWGCDGILAIIYSTRICMSARWLMVILLLLLLLIVCGLFHFCISCLFMSEMFEGMDWKRVLFLVSMAVKCCIIYLDNVPLRLFPFFVYLNRIGRLG